MEKKDLKTKMNFAIMVGGVLIIMLIIGLFHLITSFINGEYNKSINSLVVIVIMWFSCAYCGKLIIKYEKQLESK